MVPSHKQPVLQATEPKAITPTSNWSESIGGPNQTTSNLSPKGSQRVLRAPWRSLEGPWDPPWITKCFVPR